MSPEFKDGFQFIDEPILTPTEIMALHELPDHGVRPAGLREFADLEEFIKGENNFHISFTALPDTVAFEIYRGKLGFQRYEALFPKECEELSNRFMGRDFSNFSEEDWKLLFDVYHSIAALVDINDPDVMRDGRTRAGFLL